jgi:hypothetical protein
MEISVLQRKHWAEKAPLKTKVVEKERQRQQIIERAGQGDGQ